MGQNEGDAKRGNASPLPTGRPFAPVLKVMNNTILVAGAGGFIGGHLVAKLLQDGHSVRAVDRKPPRQCNKPHRAAENLTLNLEEKDPCLTAVNGCEQVYNLASDMGGMGLSNSTRACACSPS